MSKALREELTALNTVLDALEPLKDGERQWVLRTAADRLGVDGVERGTREVRGADDDSEPSTPAKGGAETPKRFLASKKPSNDVQKIACLAYYLSHHRNEPHFKTVELTKLNTEAAGDKIGNAAQAVANATTVSGYLAAAGGGKKQITALGEQVVEALPDQQAVRKVLAERKSSKRAKRGKRAAKAKAR